MESVKKLLQKHKDSFNSETEFELRLGNFNGKYFNSGISLEEFNRIKNKLSNPIICYITDTAFYKFPYRQRKIIGVPGSKWIYKEKKETLDLPELNMRISFAKEIVSTYKELITKYNIRNHTRFFASNKVSLIRKKERYSEVFGGWRADLTSVENFKWDTNTNKWKFTEKTYEFELEYLSGIPEIPECVSLFFKENDYYKLTGACKFIGNQPKTLERKDLHKISTGYSVTDKVDGDRMFLCIVDGRMSLIDKRLTVVPFGNSASTGILIDGEYLPKTKQFLAFDILFYNGKSVMDQDLIIRHTVLAQALASINNKSITAKKFYYSEKLSGAVIPFAEYTESLFHMAKNIWESRGAVELDGLIFTPLHSSYTKNTDTFKWKEIITIDTYIDHGVMYAGSRGKLVKLGPEYTIKKTSGLTAHNKKIYEFKWNNADSNWEAVLERMDKNFPNAVLTVFSAMKAIKENITIDDISNISTNNIGMQYNTSGKKESSRKSDLDINYRKFHNKIKGMLIDYNSKPGQTLLDLGAGKGGDLMKWESAGYTDVLAIDSSWQHIYGPNGFHERYNKIKDTVKVRVTIVWGDVTKGIRFGHAGLDPENIKILKNYFTERPGMKFDKITCNFAIHYFLESRELWGLFIRNVKLLIAKGGLFAGTYLCGDRIIPGEYLKNGKTIYSLKGPIPDKPVHDKYFEAVPKINIKTMQWDHYISEPIVYTDHFDQLMKEIKLKKEPIPESFEEHSELLRSKLSPDECKLSFTHNVFVFKK